MDGRVEKSEKLSDARYSYFMSNFEIKFSIDTIEIDCSTVRVPKNTSNIATIRRA